MESTVCPDDGKPGKLILFDRNNRCIDIKNGDDKWICIGLKLYNFMSYWVIRTAINCLAWRISLNIWKSVSDTWNEMNGVLGHLCAHIKNEMKWNESGFRPLLCTYRLNWARRTSWGWWDDWDDTVLQTQDSKFEPWRSEAEHATSRSRRLPTILTFTRGWGRNNFCFFQTAETGNRTPDSGVKGSGANHYPRAPAPLCTYRLNWAKRNSWGWWDEWDDTALQTQDSLFKPWWSEAEHATFRSRRFPTILNL